MNRPITPKERAIDYFLDASTAEAEATLTIVKRIVNHRLTSAPVTKAKSSPQPKRRHRRTKAEIEAAQKVDKGLAEVERAS